MSTTMDAILENGVLRPLRPVELQEGEQVEVVLLSKDHQPSRSRELLEHIASLPSEGPDEGFSGAEHDSILYPAI